MDSKKYEKLIELIINENEEAAKALLHDIVVEKSREIYESMMGSEDDRDMGGQVGDLMSEIEDESEGMREADEELDIEVDDEGMGEEPPMGDMDDADMGDSDMGDMDAEHTGIEDGEVVGIEGDDADVDTRLDDIEGELESMDSKLDRLLDEFQKKLSGEDMADEEEVAADDEAAADDEEAAADDEEAAGEKEEEEKLEESAQLTPVRRPANVSPAVHSPTRTKPGVDTKGRPVHMGGVGPGTGRLATAQSSGKSYQNAGGGHGVKQSSAPKPQMKPGSDSGAKSPLGSVKISSKASR